MNAPAGAAMYVYCVVETEDRLDLGPLGMGGDGTRVYTVHHRNLAAVVSETALRRCAPTRENLLAHEIVNERVIRDHTAIPMSFGTILRSETDVMVLLRSAAPALTEALATLRGKVELGLSVRWDREQAVAELEAADEAVRALKAEIEDERTRSTDGARERLGRIVEGAIEARAEALTASVYEPLRPLSVASRTGKLVGDDMLLNIAFLVERAKEEEFDQTVSRLRSRFDGLLVFTYTGPWPPYSFVNIRVGLSKVHSDQRETESVA